MINIGLCSVVAQLAQQVFIKQSFCWIKQWEVKNGWDLGGTGESLVREAFLLLNSRGGYCFVCRN